MRIKDISKENRPRERFLKYGASALSDAELLAIILQSGSSGENVIDMSNRLISKYGIDKLSGLNLKEFQEIKGIGPAKATQIKALFEFNKRYNLSKKNSQPIKSAKDVFEYSSQRLLVTDKEQFMILLLDSKNRIIKDETVSIGTLNASIIHPREVFKSAIKESANTIILIHNHPSGDPTPSIEDEKITKILFEAGELLDIKVLDHVIIGDGKYHSFKESGF
ncbi:MAG: DNA repair protein RadC [Candidatus Aenigmarchaeota archaeon]|nr:DNA repair protein RadC [Candidatus Aenigmarchaeota archaeon]